MRCWDCKCRREKKSVRGGQKGCNRGKAGVNRGKGGEGGVGQMERGGAEREGGGGGGKGVTCFLQGCALRLMLRSLVFRRPRRE